MHDSAEELIRASDLVVFATVAGRPHVSDRSWFEHNPLVLHVSLRDLAPEILLDSANVVDDVDHCLKADTSPHLAEQLTGSRDFLRRHPGRRHGRAGDGAGATGRWCSPPSGSACSTSRSASFVYARWPAPASCTWSTSSSPSCAGTDEQPGPPGAGGPAPGARPRRLPGLVGAAGRRRTPARRAARPRRTSSGGPGSGSRPTGDRLTAAAAVLRLVLGAHAGVPPDRVEIDRTCPGLRGAARQAATGRPAGCARLRVPLRRRGRRGRGPGGPVGVDVEEVGRPRPGRARAPRRLTPRAGGAGRAGAADRAERAAGFTTYWTRKEALVKATGDGLRHRLDAIVVRPRRLHRGCCGGTGRAVTAALRALHPPPGAVGTLAVLGRAPVQVVEHDAGPLLRDC